MSYPYRQDGPRGRLGRFGDIAYRWSGLGFLFGRLRGSRRDGLQADGGSQVWEHVQEQEDPDRGIPEAELSDEERKAALERLSRKMR